MMKNVLPVIAIAMLSVSLSACRIEKLGPDDRCAENPASCNDPSPGINTCFSDPDCDGGFYCDRSTFVCVSSVRCHGGQGCPAGLRCDTRVTCVPIDGTGGVGGGAVEGTGTGGCAGGGGGGSVGGRGGASSRGGANGTESTSVGGNGGGSATPACAGNADCAATNCCVSGACQPRPGTDTPLCRFDSECGGNARCRNGACERNCTGTATAECGTGDSCVSGSCGENPASGGRCVYNTDCAATGQLCVNGGCRPACQTDAQCVPLDRCESGYCQADHRPRPQCKGNGDCGGGQICVNAACRNECASSADCCTCGSATVCQEGLCVTPGEAVPQCRLATDCGAQQSCVDAVCAK